VNFAHKAPSHDSYYKHIFCIVCEVSVCMHINIVCFMLLAKQFAKWLFVVPEGNCRSAAEETRFKD